MYQRLSIQHTFYQLISTACNSEIGGKLLTWEWCLTPSLHVFRDLYLATGISYLMTTKIWCISSTMGHVIHFQTNVCCDHEQQKVVGQKAQTHSSASHTLGTSPFKQPLWLAKIETLVFMEHRKQCAHRKMGAIFKSRATLFNTSSRKYRLLRLLIKWKQLCQVPYVLYQTLSPCSRVLGL